MTAASEPDPDPSSQAALAARVGRVIRERFGGNAAAAARSLGLSARLIQRVTHDRQPPPARLLTALASLDGVDPAWLLTGKPGRGPEVPLLFRLIPGPLTASHFPGCVQTVPAPPDVARPSVYGYHVAADDAVLKAKDLMVQGGDVLYIDSDSWIRFGVGTAAEPHRLVVWAWLAGPDERVPMALLGDVRTKDGECVARVFGRKAETHPYIPFAGTESEPPGYPPAPGPGDVLGSRHIAGVVIALVRIDLGIIDFLKRL